MRRPAADRPRPVRRGRRAAPRRRRRRGRRLLPDPARRRAPASPSRARPIAGRPDRRPAAPGDRRRPGRPPRRRGRPPLDDPRPLAPRGAGARRRRRRPSPLTPAARSRPLGPGAARVCGGGTHLAILDTGPPGPQSRRDHFRRGSACAGDYTVDAISPRGGDPLPGPHRSRSGSGGRARRSSPSTCARCGLAAREERIRFDGEVQTGTVAARTQDASGRHVYTLSVDDPGPTARLSLLGLDTVRRHLRSIELVELRGYRDPFALDLRIDPSGASTPGRASRTGSWPGSACGRLAAPPRGGREQPARRPGRADLAGSSADSRGGRPIELHEVGELALPAPTPRLRLHPRRRVRRRSGSSRSRERLPRPGPAPLRRPQPRPRRQRAGARGSNARGVDLNRNFAAGWRAIGAARRPRIRRARARSRSRNRGWRRGCPPAASRAVTIWFHQHWGERLLRPRLGPERARRRAASPSSPGSASGSCAGRRGRRRTGRTTASRAPPPSSSSCRAGSCRSRCGPGSTRRSGGSAGRWGKILHVARKG